MEFVHGCKINDLECLKNAGINPAEAAKLLAECFAKQIYIHGFIHSDPHPGNLLVRTFNKKTQLVLLDHGLYKEFPEKLRIWYCKLWRALILRNNEDIEKYGRKLGCGEYSNIFALILTFRPPTNVDIGLENKLTEQDKIEIRSMFKGKSFGDGLRIVTQLLQSLPPELLFVLRTTNLLRSINNDLGSLVNRFAIMARTSLQGIHKKESATWWNTLRSLKVKLEFEFKLQLFSLIQYLVLHLGTWWLPNYFRIK